MNDSYWRKCSTCKTPIAFNVVYWVCNVSTCNRKNTAYVFCSVDCWDAHVPTERHKNAWAEERRSPKVGQAEDTPPKKRVEMKTKSAPPRAPGPTGGKDRLDPAPPDEILVVASKVKAYIKARSGMNTSASVMDALSDHVRRLCDVAIRNAQKNERKTVMDRDL